MYRGNVQYWTRSTGNIGMFLICWYITTESMWRVNLGKRKLNTAISAIHQKVPRALNVTLE